MRCLSVEYHGGSTDGESMPKQSRYVKRFKKVALGNREDPLSAQIRLSAPLISMGWSPSTPELLNNRELQIVSIPAPLVFLATKASSVEVLLGYWDLLASK